MSGDFKCPDETAGLGALNISSPGDSRLEGSSVEVAPENCLSSIESPTKDQQINGKETHKGCSISLKKQKRKRRKRKPKDTNRESVNSENKAILNMCSAGSSDESEGNVPNEKVLVVTDKKTHESSNISTKETISLTDKEEVENVAGVSVAVTEEEDFENTEGVSVPGCTEEEELENAAGVSVADRTEEEGLENGASVSVPGHTEEEQLENVADVSVSGCTEEELENAEDVSVAETSSDSDESDCNKSIQNKGEDIEENYHSRNCRCIADVEIMQECSSQDAITCIEQLNKIFTAIDVGKERSEADDLIFRKQSPENERKTEGFKNTSEGKQVTKQNSPYANARTKHSIQKVKEGHQDVNQDNNKNSKTNKNILEIPKSPKLKIQKHVTDVAKNQQVVDLSGISMMDSKCLEAQGALKMKNFMSGGEQKGEKSREKQKLGSPKHKQFDRSETLKAEVTVFSNTQDVSKTIGKSSIQKDKSPNKSEFPKNKTYTPGNGKTKNKKKNITFEDHWPIEKVREGLKQGNLIEGAIRINPKSFTEAYVTHPNGGSQDILIEGIKDRNRALDSDVVVLQIKPPDEWKFAKRKQTTSSSSEVADKVPTDADSSAEIIDDSKMEKVIQDSSVLESCKTPDKKAQMTAKVIAITTFEHSRKCVGYLKLMKDGDKKLALFSPRDSRIPRLHIFRDKCPPTFWEDPASKEKVIYLAKICTWSNVKFATGEIIEEIGETGDLGAETIALLEDNDLDVSPHPPSFSQYYSTSISEDEIKKREDLRKECIFTIDPITAKDLDDAVSCKELKNGNLEIGVHISDVSYFLSEGTPLDALVEKRATSVYLVEKVYHMLPVELCLSCSLLPGIDKLAYSVVWEMTHDAKIIKSRITRSVINSCAKLAYEHAQEMLENPKKQWTTDELPPIRNGYNSSDLSLVVNRLQKISEKLRAKRFKDGSLRIDQIKVSVHLNSAGLPISYEEYVNKESHRLIEELALLANMTVAEYIYDKFPTIAFLRNHPEPHALLLKFLQESMEARGIHLDVSTAGALQTSLSRYAGDDFLSKSRMIVLNMLCAKTMARAKYFCASKLTPPEFCHYALSVPFYTHFTSPIRRYADIMVHRLLNAALGYSPEPDWTPDSVQKIALNCNKQKYASKMAGEQSVKLYLAMYMRVHEPVTDAVVIDVKDHSFDIIVFNIGTTIRVYVNKLNADTVFSAEDQVHMLTIKWRPTDEFSHPAVQIIEVFTVVKVKVKCSESELKMEAILLHPIHNTED